MSSEQTDIYPPWNFSWVSRGKIAGLACPRSKANMRFLLQKGINHLITLSPENTPAIAEFPQMKWTTIPVEEFEPPTLNQIIAFINICKQAEINQEATLRLCEKLALLQLRLSDIEMQRSNIAQMKLKCSVISENLAKAFKIVMKTLHHEIVVILLTCFGAIADIFIQVIGVHCRQGIGRTGTMLACYLVHFQHLEPRTAIRTLRISRPGSCETYEQEDIVSSYHDYLNGTFKTTS